MNLEKQRLSNFSLNSNSSNSSLFSNLDDQALKFVKKLSQSLDQYTYTDTLKKPYQKYTNSELGLTATDYVTIKILSCVIFGIFAIIGLVTKLLPSNLLITIFCFIIGYIIPDLLWLKNYRFHRQNLDHDLGQSINVLLNSIKDYNLPDSIDLVISSTTGSLKKEYLLIKKDINAGLAIEDAFLRTYKRTKIKEFKYMATAFAIDSTHLITTITIIQERFDYKNTISNALEKTNHLIDILSITTLLIPLVLFSLMFTIYPAYFNFTTKISYFIFIIIILLYLIFFYIIRCFLEVNEK